MKKGIRSLLSFILVTVLVLTALNIRTYAAEDGNSKKAAVSLQMSEADPEKVLIGRIDEAAAEETTDGYFKAIHWGYENGIYENIAVNSTRFGAKTACTRADFVTFVFNYNKIK